MAMHNKSKTRMKKTRLVDSVDASEKKNIRVKRALRLTRVVRLVLTCTVLCGQKSPEGL